MRSSGPSRARSLAPGALSRAASSRSAALAVPPVTLDESDPSFSRHEARIGYVAAVSTAVVPSTSRDAPMPPLQDARSRRRCTFVRQKAARRRLRTTFPRAASRRAPCVGVDEDPVCGKAHCALGPYFAAKLGRADLLARVASPRGGDVRVCVRGDREQSCAAWRARSRHDDGAAVAWAAEGRLSLTLSEPDKAPPPPPRSAGEPGWARMAIWADAACRIVVPCTLMGRAKSRASTPTSRFERESSLFFITYLRVVQSL